MRARMRDAVVLAVLAGAGLLALLAWHPLGRWVALAIALAGVLVAAAVYRARPSAVPLRGPEEQGEHETSGAARSSKRRPS